MAEAWQSAWVEVLPDFKNFKSKANREMSSTLGAAGDRGGITAGKSVVGGITGTLKGAGGLIAGAVAALGIGKLVGDAIGAGIRYSLDSVQLASDLSETKAAVGEIFGGAAADIQAFSETANKALGQTRQQVLEGAQSFGVFGKAAGLQDGNLSKFTTDLIDLSADLAAFYNTSSDDAIQALGAGLRGESEPLRRYGVLLSDATLKARAFEMGIFKGKGSLNQQQRVLAAQAEILAQTAVAQGTVSRESEGLAFQQKVLASTLEDTQAAFGEALIPAFTTAATFANETLAPAFADIIEKVGPILGEALTEAAPLMGDLADELTPVIENMAIGAAESIPDFVDGLKDLVAELPEIIAFFKDLADTGDRVADFLNILADPDKNGANAVNEFLFGDMRDDRVKWFEDLMAIDPAMTQGLTAELETAGANAGQGLANGLKSKETEVRNAGMLLANTSKYAVANALRVQSPSKVFAELGAFVGEGFALGIEGKSERARSAALSLVSIPNVAGAAAGGVAAPATARGGVTQIINPAPGMSEETIGRVAANELNFQLRGA